MCVPTGSSGLSLGFNLENVAPLMGQRQVLVFKTIYMISLLWGGEDWLQIADTAAKSILEGLQ